jgi:hypothetical protein
VKARAAPTLDGFEWIERDGPWVVQVVRYGISHGGMWLALSRSGASPIHGRALNLGLASCLKTDDLAGSGPHRLRLTLRPNATHPSQPTFVLASEDDVFRVECMMMTERPAGAWMRESRE